MIEYLESKEVTMNKTAEEKWMDDMASPFWILGFILLLIAGLFKTIFKKLKKIL